MKAKPKIIKISVISLVILIVFISIFLIVNKNKEPATTKQEIAHEHTYIETSAKRATCTESGYVVYSCSCGDEYIEEIDPIGHIAGEWTVTKVPIQENAGSREKKCTVCGTTLETETIKYDETTKATSPELVPIEHEHEYTSEIIEKPTCTKTGTKKYSCICGASYIEQMPLTDHITKTTKTEGTCTYNATEKKTCSNCDRVIRTKVTSVTIGHEFECDEIKSATCTKDGENIYTCQKCNYVYREIVPALGHDYDLIEEHAVTCVEDGYNKYKCKTCGNEITKNYQVATGHDYVYEEQVEATCLNEGYTSYKCTKCGEEYIETSEALKHDYEEQILAEPTCTSSGLRYFVCKTCGEMTNDEEIPATGHDFEIKIVEPTPGQKGYTIYTCKNCPLTYISNYTEYQESSEE